MKLILTLFIVLLVSFNLYAGELQESLIKVAQYFKVANSPRLKDKKLIISVVNYNSQQRDRLAKKIETEFYFAMEKTHPETGLILMSESLGGISTNKTAYIKGTYEARGDEVILRFQALDGSQSGELLAQFQTSYQQMARMERALVAVLDLQSDDLTAQQNKVFSDIFRGELQKLKGFEVVSSAEVDKMNPNEIQKATGCIRDECAIVIGEQLGVDRVISSSFSKIGEGLYFLMGKILEIKTGSILASESIEHDGDLKTLKTALTKLAKQLVKGTQDAITKSQKEPKVQPHFVPKVIRKTVTTTKESTSAFQIAWLNKIRLVGKSENIRGVKLNLISGEAESVKGVDIGLGMSELNQLVGFQGSVFGGNSLNNEDPGSKSYGVQANLFGKNTIEGNFSGAQVAFVAYSRSEGILTGVQYVKIGYAKANTIMGLQVAFIGYASAKNIVGAQLGIYNYADEVTGLQFGLVNYTRKLKGIQIGLVNLNSNGPLPIMPFINVGF